ncbi:hypothetical protein AYJ54_45120 [Bradyrhizobium centrolobii]|uniref:Uncharacterized protein n=1 Tax=Bradyrhizobium centrolobii TaxID=1505087 RepID=A0A176YYR5_9BRAD|nr:hypothetical protein [Bradyrhizobium centrolobii]OAF12933.1 hypothetical protein AYJ54_45120 [Bradyrhizobium centrolobii]
MTRTYIVAAVRLVLSLTMPDAAQAWRGQDPASIAIASLSATTCTEQEARGECHASVLAHGIPVALSRKTAQARPHVHGAERPTNSPPPPARFPDHEEDPFASMHFE